MIKFTKITTLSESIGKSYTIQGDKLIKSGKLGINEGVQEHVVINSIDDMVLELLNADERVAFVYGLFSEEQSIIVPKWDVRTCLDIDGTKVQSRTKIDVCWNNGPGIMFIDHDVDANQIKLDKDDLLFVIRTVCPFLENVKICWVPSSSSNIRRKSDKKILKGLSGQHLYFVVDDARKIPNIGDMMFKKLWLEGFGHIRIGTAGQMMVRSVIDGCVWQPERLDFVGDVVLGDDLERFDVEPEVSGVEEMVITKDLMVGLTKMDEHKYNQLVLSEKKKLILKSKEQQKIWEDKLVQQTLVENPMFEERTIRKDIRNRLEHKLSTSDYLIHSSGKSVQISEILKSPEIYHKQEFADPLEPEIDKRIAILYLDKKPLLYSHLHGGQKYFIKN